MTEWHLLSNFTFIVKVYASSPNNLIMPNPDNSSNNGALTIKNLISFGFSISLFTRNTGTKLFTNINFNSLMLNSISNSTNFDTLNQTYIVMYLRNHSVNFKHVTFNCYNNRNDEQDFNTCSIPNLNIFGFRTKHREPMQGFISEIVLIDIRVLMAPLSKCVLQFVPFSNVPIIVDWSVSKNCSCTLKASSLDIVPLLKYVVFTTLDSSNKLNWCISAGTLSYLSR